MRWSFGLASTLLFVTLVSPLALAAEPAQFGADGGTIDLANQEFFGDVVFRDAHRIYLSNITVHGTLWLVHGGQVYAQDLRVTEGIHFLNVTRVQLSPFSAANLGMWGVHHANLQVGTIMGNMTIIGTEIGYLRHVRVDGFLCTRDGNPVLEDETSISERSCPTDGSAPTPPPNPSGYPTG